MHFLRKREAQGVRLLLDPVGMLTGAMVKDAADHLERILGALGGSEVLAGVVVSGAVAAGEEVSHAPLGGGVLDAGMVVGLVKKYVPVDRPWVLVNRDIERQLELLKKPR
jgi:hypothetical protein